MVSAKLPGGEPQLVKASSLPLYPEPEAEKVRAPRPPSKLEQFVRDRRQEVEDVKALYQPLLDRVCRFVDTGISHANESLIQLRDEENLVGRVGFVTAGGLLGLISARRGGIFKKLVCSSFGFAGAASVCYPREAKAVGRLGVDYAAKNARIAYHFIVGTRPAIPNENGDAFKRMSEMVSDVGLWGFRLFDRRQTDSAAGQDAPPAQVAAQETPLEPVEANEPATPKQQQPVEESTEQEQGAPETTEPEVVITDPAKPAEEPLGRSEEKTPVDEQAVGDRQNDIAPPAEADNRREEQVVVEGDLGQGLPEDKELYTTRQ